MADCIEIRDIPSRRQAEIRARVAKAEHPDWSVTVIEQDDGRFTTKACPPAPTSRDAPERTTTPAAGTPTSGDPDVDRVRPLLDLIADAESEGNYNAHFGKANNSNPDFTAMSVDQVLQWQRDFVAGGSPSSACGRYQIIRKTLKGLKSDLGLSGSERYDADTQDRMALKLLERRGVDRFLSGQRSEDDFVNSIAKEWAGLPTTENRSFYAGDGLNGATVDVSEVRGALQAIRTA